MIDRWKDRKVRRLKMAGRMGRWKDGRWQKDKKIGRKDGRLGNRRMNGKNGKLGKWKN